MSRRTGFFALAFGSGFAVLTIEIAGARLIAPVFGLSAVPWTAVIGVILAALAVGNHIGGRLADQGRVPLSRILMVAGLTGALPVIGVGVPWVARAAFGFVPGAVVSALVLFAPPVLCLGAVVPYLVRADTESLESVGRRAGDISAAATAGSIAGSFATGFLLLPAMPLTLLLGLTAAALFVMALASKRLLGGSKSGTGGVALGAVALPALGLLTSGTPADTLHAEQTLYTSVAVTEREWANGRVVRELWQNGGSSSAEYVDTGEPAHTYAVTTLDIVRELTRPGESEAQDPTVAAFGQTPAEPEDGVPPLALDRALVLGGAALTLPVALQALDRELRPAFGRTAPELRVDVVEIDPAATRLAERYFVYGERDRPGIRVVHEPGRVFLREAEEIYDLVYLDVFDHLLTVPWTMVTEEALVDMRARLAPGGVFMANVLSPLDGEGVAFLERFRATLEAAFDDVRLYIADPRLDAGATQNLVVVATPSAGTLPPLERPQAAVAARGRPLTDMWAPVEYLQGKVFLEGLRWR